MESKEEERRGTEPMEREEEVDVWEMANRAADELYAVRDTYFPPNPPDKISKLQSQSVHCLDLLDSVPLEQRKSPLRRATYEYLKGKILDVVPDYRKEAEDHLSKAVKLNPFLVDAWLCLGHCFWKKGDLPAAKNCFNLALSKQPNKKVLRSLSMLERRMAQDAENPEEVVEESIQHAKDAIALDVKDGHSWYNLGNACLTSFFVSGAWDHSKLLQSLKAYQNAEKDERMKSNPDLSFHCGTVNKYLENYKQALSGFEAAALMDPSLYAGAEVQKLVNLFDKIDSLLKGHSRSKRLAPLASSLATVKLSPSHKKPTIDVLSEGLNKAVAILAKVMFFIKHEIATPLYYMVCDSNQTCFIITVYGVHSDAIKEGDQLSLLDPFYRPVDFSWKEKHYSFRSIRVDFPEQLVVNGKTVSPHHAIRTSIFAQHMP